MVGNSVQTKVPLYSITFSTKGDNEVWSALDWTTRCDLCKELIQFSTEATKGNTYTCLRCRGYFCTRCYSNGYCAECHGYD